MRGALKTEDYVCAEIYEVKGQQLDVGCVVGKVDIGELA